MGTPRWESINIADGAYSDDTRPFSFQDTVNYLPVQAEQGGTLSPAMLRQVPGMVKFCDTEVGPGRGLRNVEGALFAVAGQHLYRIGTNASATSLGHVPGVGRTRMTHNQVPATNSNQLAIPNGSSGYVYDTATGVFQQISDDSFPGAITFDFIDQFVTYVAPNRQQAGFSDLANALSYNGLDTVQASASPDKLVGQITSHEQWWLMGERTIQPFSDTGQATGTFTADQGMTIERGCASPWCMAILDNTVFWLGENGVVYRANGYTPLRISNYPLEQAIARCNIGLAFAFIWEDRGHAVYYLTFPDGHTWGYDVSSQKWHRRQSYGLQRWMLNDLTFWNGAWYGLHFSNGGIYRLDWAANTEDGAVLERRRTTGILFDAKNRVRVNALELIFDTGQPEPIVPITLSGDMPDGRIGDTVGVGYTARGGFGTLAISVIGTVPAGVTIVNGVATGQFQHAATYNFTVVATDATGNQVTLPQTVHVLPMTISGALGNARSNAFSSVQYAHVGGIAPIAFTIQSGTIPPALGLSSSGLLSGTRTTPATYSWTVLATDALGNTATLNDSSTTGAPWLWTFIQQAAAPGDICNVGPPTFDSVTSLGLAPQTTNGSTGNIYLSHDGGRTWTVTTTMNNATSVGASMGALMAFSGVSNHWKRSGDAGATWNDILIGGVAPPAVRSIISAPQAILAMGGLTQTGYYSIDGGLNWTLCSLPAGFIPNDSILPFGGVYIPGWSTWVIPGQGHIYEAHGSTPATIVDTGATANRVGVAAYSPERDICVIGAFSGSYSRTQSTSWVYTASRTMTGMCWAENLQQFVGCDTTSIYLSPDGLTWTQHTHNIVNFAGSVTMTWSPVANEIVAMRDNTNHPWVSDI